MFELGRALNQEKEVSAASRLEFEQAQEEFLTARERMNQVEVSRQPLPVCWWAY